MKQVKDFFETVSFVKIIFSIFLAVSSTAWVTSRVMSGYEYTDIEIQKDIKLESEKRLDSDKILETKIDKNEVLIRNLSMDWQNYKEQQIATLTGMAKDVKFITETIKEIKDSYK